MLKLVVLITGVKLDALGSVSLSVTAYPTIPLASSVAVIAILLVVAVAPVTIGFVVSIFVTFPDAAPPICPSLSTSIPYTAVLLLTVIPSLAFAHPIAVALFAPLGSLLVIFNV